MIMLTQPFPTLPSKSVRPPTALGKLITILFLYIKKPLFSPAPPPLFEIPPTSLLLVKGSPTFAYQAKKTKCDQKNEQLFQDSYEMD